MLLERRGAADRRDVRSFALSLKATGDDGVIEGYASVFGVRDSYDDVIVAGAFTASLAEHKAAGTMPAMLWQHDSDQPIGVWTEMSEDTRGLRVKGQLCMDSAKGKEAYALLKMGAINGLSIGFRSVPGTSRYNDEGVRILSAIELWEVSPVTFPSNAAARVTGVKGAALADITTVRQAELALRDAGFSADQAKAFIAAVKRSQAPDHRDGDGAAAAMKAANRLLDSLTS
jgi:hypothetical protein